MRLAWGAVVGKGIGYMAVNSGQSEGDISGKRDVGDAVARQRNQVEVVRRGAAIPTVP